MENRIVIIRNVETDEWFFSTNHCQSGLSSNWVPCTMTSPYNITPREGFEEGILKSLNDFRRFENIDGSEIDNPNPEFKVIEDQAKDTKENIGVQMYKIIQCAQALDLECDEGYRVLELHGWDRTDRFEITATEFVASMVNDFLSDNTEESIQAFIGGSV